MGKHALNTFGKLGSSEGLNLFEPGKDFDFESYQDDWEEEPASKDIEPLYFEELGIDFYFQVQTETESVSTENPSDYRGGWAFDRHGDLIEWRDSTPIIDIKTVLPQFGTSGVNRSRLAKLSSKASVTKVNKLEVTEREAKALLRRQRNNGRRKFNKRDTVRRMADV